MRRLSVLILFHRGTAVPVDRARADAASNCSTTSQNLWVRDQLNDLLLLVSVPSAEREPGHVHFAGGVSRGGSLPADRQHLQLHHVAPRPTTRSTATASSSATASSRPADAPRSACCRCTTTARRSKRALQRGDRITHGQRPDRGGDGGERHDRQRLRRDAKSASRPTIVFVKPSGEQRARRAWSSGSSPFRPCR